VRKFIIFEPMGLIEFFFKLTHWESWHYHVKYIPIAPVWLWYCARARSFWFFTASNPSLTFGGFEGEGKKEMYDQLPPRSYPKSVFISTASSFSSVKELLESHHFSFPFVVKPDVGSMGLMFRKVNSEKQLKRYHKRMHANYLVQELIEYPLEVSVFYYLMPDAEKGTVTGFLLKQQPEVIGDGKSTLFQLIKKNKDLKYKLDEINARHRERLDMILPDGEKFILSHASNRSQGGKLINLAHEIDDKLVSLFDSISRHTKYFYYGRYDIKCSSIEDLKNGSRFSILEYNGAGAGIQHVYGNGLTLWQACATILQHWKILYRISIHNNKKNKIPYWEHQRGRKFLKSAMQNLALLEKLDKNFPVS
jgi:hypothetical protein